ncbi:UNVERIFIED_CONTAM: hypothetical protein PYX00_001986 [Menopon gallinae]|uniref:Uncharacterized protein n=1 Tax=Menopon gallinae TaxID=328185 RepID=A0AAW2IH57_9NEOP
MYQVRILLVLAVVTAVYLHHADARPFRTLSRQKRISDQRLAELETLIALSKMKSKMVTIPVGFGRVDPLKIGRRKRSLDLLLKTLLSDLSSQEDREEEEGSEEYDQQVRTEGRIPNDINQWIYDTNQKIARYRHLPVRLPE